MLKKYRRITGLFMVFVMAFVLFTTPNVLAATGVELDPQYVTGVPSISSISTVSGDLVKGASEKVRVNIFFAPNPTVSDVNCSIKVYFKKNSTDKLLATKQVVITSTTSVDIPVTFPSVGSAQIYAKLYVSSNELDISSLRTITVMGKWRIRIDLPEKRTNEGTLKLYDGNGTLLLLAPCLGLSATGDDMLVEKGHTPTGEYTGYLGGPQSDTNKYGPHKVVKMDGVSGKIIESERSGIWIHGGRNSSPTATNYDLSATYGCVRVTNGHQKQIQDLITALINEGYHYSTGNISIVQEGD